MEHDGREGQEPRMRAGDRDQWVRVLATKPEDLSSIPESHMVEGELTPSCPLLFLWVPQHTCLHTHNKSKNKKNQEWEG